MCETLASSGSGRRSGRPRGRRSDAQRAAQASELQGWSEPATWSGAPLIPMIRAARHDDTRILELCDRMDRATIATYELELKCGHEGRLQSVLRPGRAVLLPP